MEQGTISLFEDVYIVTFHKRHISSAISVMYPNHVMYQRLSKRKRLGHALIHVSVNHTSLVSQ